MTTSRTLRVSTLAAGLALIAGACDSTASADRSAHPSPTATASVSATTAASPTSSAVPTNWKTVNLKNIVQVQVPPTWKVTPGPDPMSDVITVVGKDGSAPGGVNLGIQPNIGGTGDMKADVAALASANEKLLVHEGDLANIKRLPDVVSNGVELYHLQYQDAQKWLDDFGGVTADGTQEIVVGWVFNREDIDRKAAEAFEVQVMPTYRLL